jgi:host factor-I protein
VAPRLVYFSNSIIMSTPVAFDTSLPSVRHLQHLVRERQRIELKLLSGDQLQGRLFWQDTDCLCLQGEDDQLTLVWRNAIAFLRPLD